MAALDRIRTQGFRRWYERQLLECHAWLLTWFLGLILLVSGIEISGYDRNSAFVGAFLILTGLLITLYSWKRYRVMLKDAERLGEQAVCPKCKAYSRFQILSFDSRSLAGKLDEDREFTGQEILLNAQCRTCGTQWVMK